MNYQDYIWDLGGTLLDNYELSTQAFLKTLEEFNLSGDHDAVYQKLKESTDSAVTTFALQEPLFLASYKKNEASRLADPLWAKGCHEILHKIVSEGSRNFLISHRDNQVLLLLKQAHLSPYFTEVITASDGFKRKPSPESLLYLKEKYDICSGLVIGDREIDKEAGQAAGFDTLLVDGKKSLLETVN